MTPTEHYRTKAAELRAKARLEPKPWLRAEYELLATSYLKLVEQAERNSHLDIVYETPRAPDQAQPQQQPQSKLKPDE